MSLSILLKIDTTATADPVRPKKLYSLDPPEIRALCLSCQLPDCIGHNQPKCPIYMFDNRTRTAESRRAKRRQRAADTRSGERTC